MLIDDVQLHANLADGYRAIAAVTDTDMVAEAGGWLFYDSLTGIAALNHAVVIGDPASCAIEQARSWFGARRSGYCLFLRDLADASVIEEAEGLGYVRERSQPVMARNLPLPQSELPAGTTFEAVQDRAAASRYLSVRADRPNDHPPDDEEAAFIHRMVSFGLFRYFVATLDGRPVARASAFASRGVVSVSNVFVAPEARRQGLGAAVTAHACASARNATVAVLEASAMGEPLYRRMGFETRWHHVRLEPPESR